jgi:metallophosphoesterase (TIGR03767 family)
MTPNDLKKALTDPTFLVKALTLSPSVRAVTPDAKRRLLSRGEMVAEHFRTTGTPVGHGFTERNKRDGTAYYSFVKGGIRFVVLDTVNPHGYADGSLDATQLAWLKTTLAASRDQLTIVSSHHNSGTMTNPLLATGGDPTDDTGPRVLGDEVVSLLLANPQVVAWVNGHSHVNQIWAHKRADGSGGFWEVNTASHVDWPQQSRLIEVLDNADGTLSIFTTMVDHAGPASYGGRTDSPVRLAGLARELSANDPQERTSHREGERGDRNVELLLKNPL